MFERNVFLPRTRSSSHGAIPSAVHMYLDWGSVSTVNTASHTVERQSDLVFEASFRVLDVQRQIFLAIVVDYKQCFKGEMKESEVVINELKSAGIWRENSSLMEVIFSTH